MKTKAPSQLVDKKELAKAGDQWLRGHLRKKKLSAAGLLEETQEIPEEPEQDTLPTTHPAYVPPVQVTIGLSTPYQGVILPKGMVLICGGTRSSKLTFAVKLISQARSVLVLSDNNVSVLNKYITGYLPTRMLSSPLPHTLYGDVALIDPLPQIKPATLMRIVPADVIVAIAPASGNLVFKHFAIMTILVKNKTWEVVKSRHSGILAHGVV